MSNGRKWTEAEREEAKRYARIPADKLRCGPQAYAFRRASLGYDDETLFGVHLILKAAASAASA